jgi:hypothetical protein
MTLAKQPGVSERDRANVPLAETTIDHADGDDNLLPTTRQAAAYTPYTPHGLENLRSAGKGPAYIKIRYGGAVAYRLADLLAWQQQHRIGTLDQD